MATENLNKLRDQIKVLLDAATDKDTISSLTSINDTISSVESDYTKLETEQKDLLKDYKEVIKYASFGDKEPVKRGTTAQGEPKSFEQVLADFKAKKNK